MLSSYNQNIMKNFKLMLKGTMPIITDCVQLGLRWVWGGEEGQTLESMEPEAGLGEEL